MEQGDGEPDLLQRHAHKWVFAFLDRLSIFCLYGSHVRFTIWEISFNKLIWSRLFQEIITSGVNLCVQNMYPTVYCTLGHDLDCRLGGATNHNNYWIEVAVI